MKKLARLILSLLVILFVFQLQTIEVSAESASSAMQRAAKKYGWTWNSSKGVYFVAQCALDGSSNKNLYFTQWEVQLTCTNSIRTFL